MTTKPETMIAICDSIASGIMSYSKACAANGLAPSTFWDLIKRSQGGDEKLIIEYLGSSVPFHMAINGARRIAYHELRGRVEQKSIFGFDELVYYMGEPTWKRDPRTIGWTEDEREAFGFSRDGLLRDENGACIQNVVHHEAPIALQLRVLEQAFPAEYRPGTNSTVAISGGAVVGVQMMKPTNGPPKIPAPPKPLPQLEVLTDADELAIPETDAEDIADDEDDLTDVTDTPPEDDLALDDFTPLPPTPPAPEPERVITGGPLPEQYQPTPQIAPLAPVERAGRPLSDLERDLLSRARARGTPVMVQPKLDRGGR
jgi:hypothetical protein